MLYNTPSFHPRLTNISEFQIVNKKKKYTEEIPDLALSKAALVQLTVSRTLFSPSVCSPTFSRKRLAL